MTRKGFFVGMFIMAAVFGTALVACNNGNNANPFTGEWTKENFWSGALKVICTENTWTANYNNSPVAWGTYTYSGADAQFAVESTSDNPSYTGTMSVTLSNGKMIITGFTGPNANNVNGTYSR